MARAAAGVAEAQGHDLKVMSLIGAGHFFSHLYILILPPLFPAAPGRARGRLHRARPRARGAQRHDRLTQAPVGFLVDRFGARGILIAGLALFSLGDRPGRRWPELSDAAAADGGRRPRQQRLPPGRLRDPVGRGRAPADGARVLDPHLRRLCRLRRGAGHHGRADRAGRLARRPAADRHGRARHGGRPDRSQGRACGLGRTEEGAGLGGTLGLLLTSPAVLGGFAFFLLLALGDAGSAASASWR